MARIKNIKESKRKNSSKCNNVQITHPLKEKPINNVKNKQDKKE